MCSWLGPHQHPEVNEGGLLGGGVVAVPGHPAIQHRPGGHRPVADACLALPDCVAGHIVYAWGEDPNTEGDFPDPDRTLESYMTELGETPTFEAYLALARQQSRANWRPELTAAAVNHYIRAGFGVVLTD